MRDALLVLLLALAIPARADDCTILLHGLARTADSMAKLAEALQEAGFNPVNIGYPSRDQPIEVLADSAIPKGLVQCEDGSRVNFVTHSMGGILVRQYLANNELPGLHRVVMLGPPNSGSEVVDALGEMPGFYWLNGEAGLQLGTDSESVPLKLGPADFETGVIAGNRSINLILSGIIPGEDDGKVAVRNTRLEGMNDFIVLPVSHTFLPMDDDAIEQVIHYLDTGRFKHPGPPAD